MSEYRALYRKYRPQRFSEVVGQGHVTDTLAHEVQAGTVAHAYLFAGPRGTGKTTSARILAKALNCPDLGEDGEPCGVCFSCVSIADASSIDVIELDAASHNKVEDVREIRANVGTVASAGGARRVYILDEAHMLSRAAANALLKTLEEPPEHAHFVLATTEPYKLPDTIRSRAQRFDFHPVGSEPLIGHLGSLAEQEGYQADHDALTLIVRHAGGSVRDAIGLLEQVAALGSGSVDTRGVTRALGLAEPDAFAMLVKAVAGQDAAAALALVSSLAGEGADLRRFVADAIEFFRGLFLALYAANLEEILDEPSEVLEEWRANARLLEPADVLRCIDRLGEALVELREGRDDRLVVELALLQMTRPETAPDAASLAARLDRLEDRVRLLHDGRTSTAPTGSGRPDPSPADAGETSQGRVEPHAPPGPATPVEMPEASSGAGAEPVSEREPPPEPEPTPPPPSDLDLEAVDAAWPAIVAGVREEAGPRRHALFREARPAAVEGGKLVLEVAPHLPFHLAGLVEDDVLNAIVVRVASGVLGGTIELTYREGNDAGQAPSPASDPEPVRAPDKDQLAASDDGAIDPASLVLDEFGGEIVGGDEA